MDNSVVNLPLTQGVHCTVNLHSYQKLKVSHYRWLPVRHTKNGITYTYAAAHICGRPVFLHRLLAGATGKARVNHRDGDTLNNTDKNLQIRQCNRPKYLSRKGPSCAYKGVTWARTSGKWMARVIHEGKTHYLGLYVDKHRAARAYDRKAKELFGESAGLNFTDGAEQWDQTGG